MRMLLVTLTAVASLTGSALASTLPQDSKFENNVAGIGDAQTAVATHLEAVPEAVDISPDGRTLWVGNNRSHNIYVFDADTMDRLDYIEGEFPAIQVRFHPMGHAVAVADLNRDRIVIFDAESRGEIAEVDLQSIGATNPASLLFAPDGSSLFVGTRTSGNVVEIDTQDWTVNRILSNDDDSGLRLISDFWVKV